MKNIYSINFSIYTLYLMFVKLFNKFEIKNIYKYKRKKSIPWQAFITIALCIVIGKSLI